MQIQYSTLKWIKKVNQSCPKTRTGIVQNSCKSCPKTRTGIVQNSCKTVMKGFDPLQMLTPV